MTGLTLVALTSLLWMSAFFFIGWRAVRWSDHSLASAGPLTRIRSWERSLRWYRTTLRITSWKDRIPEAGDFFAGGISKRHLPDGATVTLIRFVLETRRAERCHWMVMAFGPTFLIWTPWWFAVTNTIFGIVANTPFVLVQRFNRIRSERSLARRGVDAAAIAERCATPGGHMAVN